MASVLCLMNLKHSALGEMKSRKVKVGFENVDFDFCLRLIPSCINRELYEVPDYIRNNL